MSVETVLVRRLDNGREVEVAIGEIRWWLDLDKPVAAFAAMHRHQQRGDVPYIRRFAGSRWCVRVEFVESLEAYRRELARIMGRGLIGEGWTNPDAIARRSVELADQLMRLLEIEASGSSISDGADPWEAGGTRLDPTGSQPAPSRLVLAFRAALRSVPPAGLDAANREIPHA